MSVCFWGQGGQQVFIVSWKSMFLFVCGCTVCVRSGFPILCTLYLSGRVHQYSFKTCLTPVSFPLQSNMFQAGPVCLSLVVGSKLAQCVTSGWIQAGPMCKWLDPSWSSVPAVWIQAGSMCQWLDPSWSNVHQLGPVYTKSLHLSKWSHCALTQASTLGVYITWVIYVEQCMSC